MLTASELHWRLSKTHATIHSEGSFAGGAGRGCAEAPF